MRNGRGHQKVVAYATTCDGSCKSSHTVKDHKIQTDGQPSNRFLLGSVIVAIGCFIILLSTSGVLPMVWDEGNAINRSDGILRWASRWFSEDALTAPIAREVIKADWQYTTQKEGHPAFYGTVVAIGRVLGSAWLSPLDAGRVGPILLFCVAVGVMFWRVANECSPVAAVGATATLLLMPRMFAHAHFASIDGPLTSCWILTWAAFTPARRSWLGAIIWGLILGMTLSTKATGWIAPLPFIGWAILYRDRKAAMALAIGLPTAAAMFLALNPPLWHNPIDGLITFLQLNLNRDGLSDLNISTLFLGHMYNLDYPLPWFNTLFWTVITVPLPLLFLATIGLGSAIRNPLLHKNDILVVANWAVLLIVRALPYTPPHDGIRLFLPSFAFLAILSGIGCGRLVSWARARNYRSKAQSDGRRTFQLTAALIICCLLGSASSLFWHAPQWLSYYNLTVGGLSGATALGMEPTYYWDSLDKGVIDWLNKHTTAEEKIVFGAAPAENLELMQRWGIIVPKCSTNADENPRWYVVQNRPSGMLPVDRWLVKHCKPAMTKKIHHVGFGPWRLDTPLLFVYTQKSLRTAQDNVNNR